MTSALKLHSAVRARIDDPSAGVNDLNDLARDAARALAPLRLAEHPVEFGRVAATLAEILDRRSQADPSVCAETAEAYRTALLASDPDAFGAEFVRLQTHLGRCLRRAAEWYSADPTLALPAASLALDAALSTFASGEMGALRASALLEAGIILQRRAALPGPSSGDDVRRLVETASRHLLDAADTWQRLDDDAQLAATFLALGDAFAIYPDDGRTQIIERAVAFYRRADEFLKDGSNPVAQARVRAGLGLMLLAHPGDKRPRLVPVAIQMLGAAVLALDGAIGPLELARLHHALAAALLEPGGRTSGDGGPDAGTHLRRARDLYAAAGADTARAQVNEQLAGLPATMTGPG